MNQIPSWDRYWQIARYILLMGGSFLAGNGYVTTDQITSFVEDLPAVIGAATAFGTAAWGLYVKFGTRAVPAAVAARPDVPTVSSATGKIETAK